MKIHYEKTDCPAAEVNYDSRRLDAVNKFFTRMIENKIIYGVSYRLARRGKIFAAASLGGRHYNNPGFPMLPDTPFGIASQTKMFTAVAVLMLAEDGLISIDDTVAKYLPQFDGSPYNEITLMHLLTHTSGLYPEGSIPDKHHVGAYEHIRTQYDQDGASTDWIAAGLRGGMRRKPGTEWQYCSFGITVLGAILEEVTGIKYKTFIIDKICTPLGMTSTTFDPSPTTAKNAIVFNEWNEKFLSEVENGIKSDEGPWDIMPSAASGLFSTTEDMVSFGIMLEQKGRVGDVRILGRKAVELMATQRLFNIPDICWGSDEKDRKYGLGVDMRRFPNAFYSPGTFLHEGSGHSVLIVDAAEEMVCSCVYPWVDGKWNGDCNGRLYNVMWSGLI